MEKLFFSVFAGLLFLVSNNAGASVSSPQLSCVMRIYDVSTGETLGYVAVVNVSCCSCSSTRERALDAFNN